MEFLVSLLKSSLLVPLTLLPIINPVGNAPIFTSLTGGSDSVSRFMARQVAFNAWVILMVSMLIGTYVLALFGISLAIVRIAGGLLVAATGWHMVQAGEDDAVRSAVAEHAPELSRVELAKRSFFPMSFPLTAGPGSIAASIALGTISSPTTTSLLLGVGAASLGTALTCGVIYLCYRFATPLLKRLGEIGTLVMMRFVSFILLCIGLQMMWTGWADLNALG